MKKRTHAAEEEPEEVSAFEDPFVIEDDD